MALMLLTAQPQVGLRSLSFLRPFLHYQTVAEVSSIILVFGAQSLPSCKSQFLRLEGRLYVGFPYVSLIALACLMAS